MLEIPRIQDSLDVTSRITIFSQTHNDNGNLKGFETETSEPVTMLKYDPPRATVFAGEIENANRPSSMFANAVHGQLYLSEHIGILEACHSA